jgi:hypothetical protein
VDDDLGHLRGLALTVLDPNMCSAPYTSVDLDLYENRADQGGQRTPGPAIAGSRTRRHLTPRHAGENLWWPE